MFEDLIPEFQDPARDLLRAAGQAGLQPRITSTTRSRALQTKLYRRWLSGQSPLPAAPPGTSAHEYGYAFDMVVSPWASLADVGYTWQTWGGIWGGERDPVHFEYPGFVPPAVPQEETSWWDWASILLPTKALDTGPAMELPKSAFHSVWCRWFPNSSSCRQ